MSVETLVLDNYIGGKWVTSKSRDFIDVTNPATGGIISRVAISTKRDVDLAVESAKHAFEEWRHVPLNQRIGYLSRLRQLLIEHSEEIARIITVEHGKVLADARGEMVRVIENATKALDVDLVAGKILSNIAAGQIQEYSMRVPIGTFSIVTPFNFPAMIAFWSLPYAILTGNTLIIKPSEQAPITMNRIFELIHEAGFPPGVVNLLHGNKVVVDHLLEHPDISGVCSVTSTPAMKAIHQKAALSRKRFVCQGGAKNFVVVLPDVDHDKIVPHIIDSFYGNSGQRCLAGGNLVVVGHSERRYRVFVRKLLDAAQKIRVGNGLENVSTMGPVISQAAKERIIEYIEQGIQEGAQLILDGRTTEVKDYPKGYWLGPSIFTEVTQEMTIATEEIFGPVMPILRAETLDEAIATANASNFGNAGMIFTSNAKARQQFKYELNVGNIGIDIGLPAPIPPFPFGGMKDSFRGDLHGQGDDAAKFFTQEKVIIERCL